MTITRVRTDGSVSVRTAAGEATIEINPRQIPAFVRPGTVVSVSLQQTENGLQALLQPRAVAQANAPATPLSGSPQSSSGATGIATSTTASATTTLPQLSDGQIVRAIVLRTTSLSQGIAGGPLLPTTNSPQPQHAAQAAARYLLASGPYMARSGSLPFAARSALFQAASPPQTLVGNQPVSNPSATVQQTSAKPDTGTQGNPKVSRQPVPPGQTAAKLTLKGSSLQSRAGAASTAPGHAARPISQSATTPATSGTAAAETLSPKPRSLPPGATFPVRVLSIGAQTNNALSAQSSSGGSVISGTIIATGGSGQAIVNSSVGLLDIAARAENGQLQSAIRMEVLGRSDNDVRGRAEGGSQTPLSVLAREWPALEESLRILEMAAPQNTAQLTSAIARPGPQLTASILFFLAAVRAGSLGGWLGKDAGQALEKASGRLLSTLSGDFQSMSRASEGGPETAGWRAFFMPVQTQDTLEQMRFFILPPSFRDSDENDDEGNEKQNRRGGGAETRFVVDLVLSGLGPFRIDGSVSEQSMSLLLRTRRDLLPKMKAEIIEIFDKATERTGMSGAVSFKVQREFPPLPIADLIPEGRQNPDVYA